MFILGWCGERNKSNFFLFLHQLLSHSLTLSLLSTIFFSLLRMAISIYSPRAAIFHVRPFLIAAFGKLNTECKVNELQLHEKERNILRCVYEKKKKETQTKRREILRWCCSLIGGKCGAFPWPTIATARE